jgi:hypothetical protein
MVFDFDQVAFDSFYDIDFLLDGFLKVRNFTLHFLVETILTILRDLVLEQFCIQFGYHFVFIFYVFLQS